jgi:hypothetical protein
MENYGAHDWDGTGVCPQRWKYKGGSEYKIKNIPINSNARDLVKIVDLAESHGFLPLRDDEYCREYVMEWSIESDDYKSWFEKSQLEYDGEITNAEPSVEYETLIGD